ncbi:MAG: phosphatase PAP2 family protein [Candidatus Aenigmatarchaeota archaeon]
MLENLTFDQNLLLAVNHIQNPVLDFILPLASLIGSIYATAIFTAIIWMKNPKLGAILAISLLIGQTMTYGLKAVIDRPRPSVEVPGLINRGIEKEMGPENLGAFPSGHTNRIFTVATVASTSLYSAVFWIPVAILASFSMIFIGAHFPLDVLGGIVIAVAVSCLVIRYQKKFSALIRLSERIHSMIFGRFKKDVPLS